MDVSGNYWKIHTQLRISSTTTKWFPWKEKQNKNKIYFGLLNAPHKYAAIQVAHFLLLAYCSGSEQQHVLAPLSLWMIGLFMQIQCQLYPPSEPFAYYMMKTTKPRQEAHPCWEEAAISVCRAALSANSQSMSHTVLQHPDELFQNWRGPFTDCERQILWNHWTSFSVRVSTFILKILRSRGK